MDKNIFKEGRQAYFEGKLKQNNPYDIGTEDAASWQKGFKAGEREDIEQDPDGN